MTDNFQNIDGIGPAREEHLKDSGYETYSDLAEADAPTLEGDVPRLSEDTALEIIVQAQNMADLEEAETEENPEVEEESETVDVRESYGEGEAQDSDDEETEPEATEGPQRYTVELTVESDEEYDALYDTLLQHRQTLIGTNRAGVGRATKHIDELRVASVGDTLTFELTADELNRFHNAVRQQRLDYQGRNLREQLEALRRVENRVNDIREEHLF